MVAPPPHPWTPQRDHRLHRLPVELDGRPAIRLTTWAFAIEDAIFGVGLVPEDARADAERELRRIGMPAAEVAEDLAGGVAVKVVATYPVEFEIVALRCLDLVQPREDGSPAPAT